MDNIEMFHYKKVVAAETVGFRFAADLFKSVPIIISFVVVDNVETFQNQNMIAAENVGFWFEADVFKSVQIIIGFGFLEQHWYVSQ